MPDANFADIPGSTISVPAAVQVEHSQKDPGLRPLPQPCFLGWMLGCCVLRHLGRHVEPVPSSFGRQDSQVPHGDSMSHLSWIAGVSLFSDLCCCH